MNLHTGIVLKHYAPKKNICALLDKRLGRIAAVVIHDTLSAGTVLRYQLTQKKQWYVLDAVEIVDMPLAMARYDMLFLHYILEMCYHFTIQDSGPDQLYDLLIFVCNYKQFTPPQKKRILCVLAVYLDLYPDDATFSSSYLHALAQKPLQEVIDTNIDANIEKNISRWLYQCIRVHVPAQKFKTIHFLDEMRP